MTHPLETYLKSMHLLHISGGARKETSYYPPLANLIDAVGQTLSPKVFCVSQVVDTGGGSPDFGLYTANQRQRGAKNKFLPGVPPERGVVEVKGVDDDTWRTASGEQVTRYWGKYGQVLVTNYRDFLLVGCNAHGEWATLESFRLADDAADFWQRCEHPRKTVQEMGDRLIEYLKRALLSSVELKEPEDVAWLLASYARDAKARMDAQGDLPGMQILRQELEAALGISFSGTPDLPKARKRRSSSTMSDVSPQTTHGERFFRSTLVQTLFYGVFSSWVLWTREAGAKADAYFDWRDAAWDLHVPMIANLFSQLAMPAHLKPLGLDEVMNWTGAALNRIDRPAFFAKFEEEHAVQYFYEPFLRAYDPELRKDLGVWYTPPEIVKYQVERVDAVLREELGIANGLADPEVYVLDPCCGTGAYLVETLRKIYQTLDAAGAGAITAARLKEAAQNRVFGFEILPAPFVIAHLQLGLMLRRFGAPLDNNHNERVGVYLTNALTGWEPAKEPKTKILFPELEAERAAADEVKQDKPILVILGNPPYNAFAGVSPTEESGLVDAYKDGLVKQWGIKKFNLDDLYVRFFRIAERRVVKSGKGVVSFISNFSYLSDPSFVVMRNRILEGFNHIFIDSLNGDSRETGKITPDGFPDPSIFSHPHNKAGIRVGTAITLLVRMKESDSRGDVHFRNFWGNNKKNDLLASLTIDGFNPQYDPVTPTAEMRYSFRSMKISQRYLDWPAITDLSAVKPLNGLMEKRGGSLIDIDSQALLTRMRAYFDSAVSWDAYRARYRQLTEPKAGFVPENIRKKAVLNGFDQRNIVRYHVRPFDIRWAYYSAIPSLWNRSRPDLWAQCWPGNSFFVSRPAGVATPEGVPVTLVNVLGDNDALRGHAYYFPIRIIKKRKEKKKEAGRLFSAAGIGVDDETVCANLSPMARKYLGEIGITNPDRDHETSALLWQHALAICFSPAYLTENSDGIRSDWPRIPLPPTQEALRHSAGLGKQLAALLDTETPVDSLTSGSFLPSLRMLGCMHKTGHEQVNPTAGDLALDSGWGYFGKDESVMPGRGKVKTRALSMEERNQVAIGATTLFPDNTTLDIYLNSKVMWKNIPPPVWNYTIGGYQIIKKWLSYRDISVLGRDLTLDEVDYVTSLTRRVAAIILLEQALDKNYYSITI